MPQTPRGMNQQVHKGNQSIATEILRIRNVTQQVHYSGPVA